MTRIFCCVQDKDEVQKQSKIAQNARNVIKKLLRPRSEVSTADLVDKVTKRAYPNDRIPASTRAAYLHTSL